LFKTINHENGVLAVASGLDVLQREL